MPLVYLHVILLIGLVKLEITYQFLYIMCAQMESAKTFVYINKVEWIDFKIFIIYCTVRY